MRRGTKQSPAICACAHKHLSFVRARGIELDRAASKRSLISGGGVYPHVICDAFRFDTVTTINLSILEYLHHHKSWDAWKRGVTALQGFGVRCKVLNEPGVAAGSVPPKFK